MQKIRKLVLSTTCGLMFILFSIPLESKQIWTDDRSSGFHFSDYHKVFLAVTLDDEEEKDFLKILHRVLGNKGKLEILKDPENQVLGAMGESKLWLYTSCMNTKNPGLHFLRIYVTAGAEARNNHKDFRSIPWERSYLFENEKELTQDISKALEESLSLFITQYFETNPDAIGKAVFYFSSPTPVNLSN